MEYPRVLAWTSLFSQTSRWASAASRQLSLEAKSWSTQNVSLRFCQSGLEILGAAKGAAGPRMHGHSVGLVELVANGREFVMNTIDESGRDIDNKPFVVGKVKSCTSFPHCIRDTVL